MFICTEIGKESATELKLQKKVRSEECQEGEGSWSPAPG